MPSSEVRWEMTARRSLRSSSGKPALSAKWNTRPSEDSWVSLSPSTLLSRTGPNDVIVARTGTPLPLVPPRLRNSTGKAVGTQSVAVSLARLVMRSRRRPGRGHARHVALDVGEEDRHAVGGQLLGEQLQGLGLAVPVAPATRPCRFIIDSGMRMRAVG